MPASHNQPVLKATSGGHFEGNYSLLQMLSFLLYLCFLPNLSISVAIGNKKAFNFLRVKSA